MVYLWLTQHEVESDSVPFAEQLLGNTGFNLNGFTSNFLAKSQNTVTSSTFWLFSVDVEPNRLQFFFDMGHWGNCTAIPALGDGERVGLNVLSVSLPFPGAG